MAWYAKMLPRSGWTYVPDDDPEEEDELEAKIANATFSGYLEAETEDYPNREVTDIVVVLARK
jgi:hypothetical protein